MNDRRFRLLKVCAATGGLSLAASIALLWWEHRNAIFHPAVWPFLLLLLLALLPSLVGSAAGFWRVLRGPHRPAAAAWTVICFLPIGFWGGLSMYTLRILGASEALRGNFPSRLAIMAAAAVMEAEAARTFPYRMESKRLVMFYDDRIRSPQSDLEEMDRHVASLETLTGKPLREKIHWVRGKVLGRGRMAARGLALGSTESPEGKNGTVEFGPDFGPLYLDRHELAHAVIHQLQPPDADAPTLLIEGWAESQSGMNPKRAGQIAIHSRELWRQRTGADSKRSRLRELVSASSYYRIDGAIYNVGGAFATHLLRHFGIERFLKLYFACRPERFVEECETLLGVKFEDLESAFWIDAQRMARGEIP